MSETERAHWQTAEQVLQHLRVMIEEPTYLKSHELSRDLNLTVNQVGTALGAIAAAESVDDPHVEQWGESSGRVTWYIDPSDGGETDA